MEARCWHFFKDLPLTTAGTAEQKWLLFLSDWDSLVSSLTVREYERQWAALNARHRLYALALRYIESVWLSDYKERFVYAWTHQNLHLNTVVMSRVEGCLSVLKRYIGVSH